MEDLITIKGKFKYIKRGDQIGLSYFGHFEEEPTIERGRRREEENKRGRRGRRRGRKAKRYESLNFCMQSCVFLMSRVFGMDFLWMISCSFSRVLLGDYPNPIFVEFVWIKP